MFRAALLKYLTNTEQRDKKTMEKCEQHINQGFWTIFSLKLQIQIIDEIYSFYSLFSSSSKIDKIYNIYIPAIFQMESLITNIQIFPNCIIPQCTKSIFIKFCELLPSVVISLPLLNTHPINFYQLSKFLIFYEKINFSLNFIIWSSFNSMFMLKNFFVYH